MLQNILNEVIEEIRKTELEWDKKRDVYKNIDVLFVELLQNKIGSDYKVCVKDDISDIATQRAVYIEKDNAELSIEYIVRLSSRNGKRNTEYNFKDITLKARYNFKLEDKFEN